MSQVSKNELKYDNSVSFPNNNAGAITPSDLRAFNVDLIDSTVNQTLYNTDSSSLYWKIEDADSSINSLQIFTASQDDVNATLASTGSNTFVGNQTIEGDVIISYDGVSVTLNASTLNNGLAIDNNLDVYGNITSIGNLDIDGTVTASLQSGYVWIGGVDGRLKAVPSASLVTAGTTDVVALNEFTASQQIINSGYNAFTASQQTINSGYNAFTASQQLSDTQLNAFTSSQETKNTTLGTYTGSVDTKFATIGVYTGSNDTKWNNLGNQSGSFVTESETGSFARVNVSNTFTTDQTIQGTLNVTTLNATTINTIIESSSVIFSSGSNILGDSTSDTQTLNGTVLVSGSQQVTGSVGISGNTTITGSINLNGNQNIVGQLTASALRVENNTHLDGQLRVTNDAQFDGHILIQGASPHLKLRDTSGGGISSGYDVRVDTGSFEIHDDTHNRNVLSDIFNSGSQKHTTSLTSEIIIISGSDSVTIQGNSTTLGNSTTFGNSTIVGNQTITGSLLISSSAIVELNIVGNQTITGSLSVSGSSTITGSVNGNVEIQGISSTTASFDFGTSNFFELTLVNGANTRVEATNVRKGQTVNVLVKQPATTGSGTISFSSNFDFPEIAPYTATTGPNAKDILTFITFSDTSSIYSAGVNNLI